MLFGQANAFVTWRHKFAFANRIILHYINKSGLKGSFAACARRQGLRALDWRPLPWGARIGVCEHGALNYKLSVY